MQIRKAERKKAKLRLGLGGPSGSGKTMGALLIAYGITGDWSKICLCDTEAGSGELYVGQKVKETDIVIGEYQYLRIDPDFTVSKFLEAMKAMKSAGIECGILDSASHAWAGAGGLLDKQSKIAARTGNSYTAWRDVTPDHNEFVDNMLGSPFHLIVTMRSKQDYVLEANDKGKQVPKKVGMAPVQREGMEYEFTVMLDIDMNHMASASKDRTNTLDGSYFKISDETGKKLKEWLELGIEPPNPETLKTKATALAAELDEASSIKMVDQIVIENQKLMKSLHEELPEWFERLGKHIAKVQEAFSLAEAAE